MKINGSQPDCQIKGIHYLADGPQEAVPFGKSLRLLVRKVLGPGKVKMIKNNADAFLNWYARLRGKATKPAKPIIHTTTMSLKSGDQVRVHSKGEIAATLNHWRQLKGCTFADEMEQYCNTTQRVLKPVERFVDERDLRARKIKGIVLLEGIICKGTASLGRCDRNCYYFWREEWLEKIPNISEIDS